MESHILPHTIWPWVISLHLCISSNLPLIHNVSNIPFYAPSWGDVGHIWDIWSLIHHRASTGTCHTTKYICQRHISNQHGILPQPLFSSLLENKLRLSFEISVQHLYSEGGERVSHQPNRTSASDRGWLIDVQLNLGWWRRRERVPKGDKVGPIWEIGANWPQFGNYCQLVRSVIGKLWEAQGPVVRCASAKIRGNSPQNNSYRLNSGSRMVKDILNRD